MAPAKRAASVDKDAATTAMKKIKLNVQSSSLATLSTQELSPANVAGLDPKPEFGRLPVLDSKRLNVLMTNLNGVPVHTFVNNQAAKLFYSVNVKLYHTGFSDG